MLLRITGNYDEMSELAGSIVADRLRKNSALVLGLATGSTPLGTYRTLIRMHRVEGLDFSRVTTFNLDEYIGIGATHPQSYHQFMAENLFQHLNLDRRFTFIPDGMAPDIEAHCEWYEEQIRGAGGTDIQILGIGRNGHLAFNEPGSSLGSRTRIKPLSEETRRDNARFFGSVKEVPTHAVTMGIGTIMEARELILLASGEQKADAVKAAVEGPITAIVPASIMQMHRRAYVIVDQPAASKLTRTYLG